MRRLLGFIVLVLLCSGLVQAQNAWGSVATVSDSAYDSTYVGGSAAKMVKVTNLETSDTLYVAFENDTLLVNTLKVLPGETLSLDLVAARFIRTKGQSVTIYRRIIAYKRHPFSNR